MFGRKKKDAEPTAPAEEQLVEDGAEAQDDVRARGPWDISEVEDREGRMDFGSLLIQQQQGVGIRLEVTEKGNRPRAVNLDHKGSTVQLQAFAAPRSTGICRRPWRIGRRAETFQSSAFARKVGTRPWL